MFMFSSVEKAMEYASENGLGYAIGVRGAQVVLYDHFDPADVPAGFEKLGVFLIGGDNWKIEYNFDRYRERVSPGLDSVKCAYCGCEIVKADGFYKAGCGREHNDDVCVNPEYFCAEHGTLGSSFGAISYVNLALEINAICGKCGKDVKGQCGFCMVKSELEEIPEELRIAGRKRYEKILAEAK